MAIDSKHPQYSDASVDWVQVGDTYEGERKVKAKGTTYLPATGGMLEDGMGPGGAGLAAYSAYVQRAVFPDLVSNAVEAMVGLMHLKEPTIELPTQLEALKEQATSEGEGLTEVLRRINERQLVHGRLGLMADLPEGATRGVLPYLALYHAPKILNWATVAGPEGFPVLSLIVLDESGPVMNPANFEWKDEEKYRILALEEGQYVQKVVRGRDMAAAQEVTPRYTGKGLDFVPFTIINSKDLVADVDNPPLLGLSNMALATYRGEADYRQNLFMQGQDTLVVLGGKSDESYRIGSGAAIKLPETGDAKFIGVSAGGLGEQRQALENDKAQSATKAGEMVDTRSGDKESGDALRIRLSAQTATLTQVALAGAAGLQASLRQVAAWVGADPGEVVVVPNLDFVNDTMAAQTLVELMTAKTMGAPLSLETIHGNMAKRGLTEKTLEEEQTAMEGEGPLPGQGDDVNNDEGRGV